MGANTRDAPDLSGLIFARRRRRRASTDLLVKAAPNSASYVVFGDLFFDTATGGSPQVLTAGLFTSGTNQFPSAVVAPGTVGLAPDLFTSATAQFFAPTVVLQGPAQDLTQDTPGENTTVFFNPAVAPGGVALAPDTFTNENLLPAHVVTPGGVALSPGLAANSAEFFSPTVVVEVTLGPPLLAGAPVFFPPAVAPGGVTLAPAAYTSVGVFYTPIVGTFLSMPFVPNSAVFYPVKARRGSRRRTRVGRQA